MTAFMAIRDNDRRRIVTASSHSDVFVIGGGPVGLAAAIAARRKGFTVIVADALEPPIDKACGEGILPDGVEAAARLGIHLPAISSFTIRGIRFLGEGVSVAADFPEGHARGIRRTTLHRALVEEAERCGVDLRWGVSVPGLEGIESQWIVGADGLNSRVRKWAGLDAFRRDTRRYGFRLHFRRAPWSDYVEIYWGEGFQIYITPVAPDEIGVALLGRDPKLRVREALTQVPELAAKLDGVPACSRERGGVTTSRRLRHVTRGNVALIGDASGSIDAISGEGICLGFRQALALADALERQDLHSYESAHRRLALRPRFMADLTLTIGQTHWLHRRAMLASAAHPELFAGLLAMHVGAARKTDFAANCLELGWRILTI
ncbi:MAG TPA: FAD-dependent monooxygenase [Bryobacteraceae bacterium]|nr:FAD-dependent monooxygenase [Bryobacteraceae bacterium]